MHPKFYISILSPKDLFFKGKEFSNKFLSIIIPLCMQRVAIWQSEKKENFWHNIAGPTAQQGSCSPQEA